VPKVAAPASPAPNADDDASDPEGRLIDDARVAFSKGDTAGAFLVLAEHAARFPHGRYTATRELLAAAVRRRAAETSPRIDSATVDFGDTRASN